MTAVGQRGLFGKPKKLTKIDLIFTPSTRFATGEGNNFRQEEFRITATYRKAFNFISIPNSGLVLRLKPGSRLL